VIKSCIKYFVYCCFTTLVFFKDHSIPCRILLSRWYVHRLMELLSLLLWVPRGDISSHHLSSSHHHHQQKKFKLTTEATDGPLAEGQVNKYSPVSKSTITIFSLGQQHNWNNQWNVILFYCFNFFLSKLDKIIWRKLTTYYKPWILPTKVANNHVCVFTLHKISDPCLQLPVFKFYHFSPCSQSTGDLLRLKIMQKKSCQCETLDISYIPISSTVVN